MGADSGGDVRLVALDQYRKDQSRFHRSVSELSPRTRVLHFDYLYSPQERLAQWQEQDEDSIDEVTILYAGYRQQEPGAVERYGSTLGYDTTFTQISNPRDVEQAGLEIVKFFDRSEAETYPTVIFVDSLSAMLQYISLEDTVRFTRQCLRLFERYDTVGRFSFTPYAHSEETVTTMRSLFS